MTHTTMPFSHAATRVRLNRRALIAAIPVAGMAIAVPGLSRAAARTPMEVWKDPNCGCCHDWVLHMRAAGFDVTVHDTGNHAVRARLGLPQHLGSCHTALVGGYLIEGHVPASDTRALLTQRPTALGLAVPGMPVGSPGMDGPEYGNRRDPYNVLLVARDSSTQIFKRYKGQASL